VIGDSLLDAATGVLMPLVLVRVEQRVADHASSSAVAARS